MNIVLVDDKPLSKRFVLKVFDPLGVLAPIVINLKLLFQELCAAKRAWDDNLNEEFHAKWENLMENLPTFTGIRVPHYYMQGVDDVIEVELHGFADASLCWCHLFESIHER